MRHELLIAAGPGEWRAALLEDGAAAELYVERGDTCLAGSIHLGRVLHLTPGLDSAFVEIGEGRPGIVPVREAAADGVRLDEGARVLVQVRREAQQDKGARLSTRLRTGDGVSTVEMIERAAAMQPPTQLVPRQGLAASLAWRLAARPNRALVDDAAAVLDLRAALPGTEVSHIPAVDWPIDVDATIEAALEPSLALPGGGRLHFEPTRTALLIDVDTGAPQAASAELGAVAINVAAAREIAWQLRLRNAGGGIVIDFVGLEGRGARERVLQTLAAALRSDPAEPQVLGWTKLGHLELVRPRRGRPLIEALLEADGAPPRKHALTLAFEALRTVQREARANPAADWRLVAAPAVERALRRGAAAGLRALEERLGRSIEVVLGSDDGAFDIVPR